MAVTAKMKAMLDKVKANLILQHDEDDALIISYIAAAVSYAESYQHKPENYYIKSGVKVPASTEQAVIMLSSHFYESRDGSTGGFFADNTHAAAQVWQAVHRLLAMHKDWMV
jgi:uncharacterized phage protein (predicted DNA packaging)